MDEQYLNVHQASEILDITEEEIWELVHKQKVPVHNIAGAFLRFKKSEVEELKNTWRIQRELFPGTSRYFSHKKTFEKSGVFENIRDFWYFNDFYIICSLMILMLLYFIISSQ